MFRGINAISLDTKGRLSIPTRYREGLGDHIVLTIDTEEPCLLLYPISVWQGIENQLQALPSFHAQARRIQRLLIGHATDVSCDTNHRILIPPLLREYAHLEQHIMMIGQGHKFEIWDEQSWQSRRATWLSESLNLSEGLPDELKSLFL